MEWWNGELGDTMLDFDTDFEFKSLVSLYPVR